MCSDSRRLSPIQFSPTVELLCDGRSELEEYVHGQGFKFVHDTKIFR